MDELNVIGAVVPLLQVNTLLRGVIAGKALMLSVTAVLVKLTHPAVLTASA